MAITSLAAIKAWFQTSDVPTETQYINTWDSFKHKEEPNGQIGAVLNESSFVIPENMMVTDIIISASQDVTIGVGDSSGTVEHWEDETFTLASGNALILAQKLFALGSDRTIFVHGINTAGAPTPCNFTLLYYIK